MAKTSEKPLEHINRIRRHKFGLLPDGTSIGLNALADDLHQATANLSEGLYSKDIHFILELVQNADDNAYAPGCQPDLEFHLVEVDPTSTPGAHGALVVINNELGFSPANVEALCAVGKSTKTKREGYIGEKGIGFKSVFLVSARPHIFSCGYQFRFDEGRDPAAGLGYIVPYWVDDTPEIVGQHRDKTCIVLPLKPGKYDLVASELYDISPEIILFLAKLRGLMIGNPESEPVTVMRDDGHRPLITIATRDGLGEYWVVEAEHAVPAWAVDEKRDRVESRKVSIACPLSGEHPERSVYAYLPTEVASGFRFLLNADFILSSSRESIQMDRPWNLWLRDCIAPTFVEAFTSLVNDPLRRFSAYRFIPVDAASEFLEPVAEQVQQTLAEQEVVWACVGDRPVLPSQTRCVTDGFRGLLGGYERLPSPLIDALPVHPEIARYGRRLRAIGVADLTQDEILACLRDDAWMDGHAGDWYIRLYRYLATQTWATAERLQGLNLLLTDDGARANTLIQPVYFPTDGTEEVVQTVRKLFSSSPHLPPDVVAFLDAGVYSAVCDDERTMRCLSDCLGVRHPSVDQFCVDLARYLNQHAEEIPIADVVRLTEFICDRYEDLGYSTQQSVKEQLPLALENGDIARQGEWDDEYPLVMPRNMDPDTGWQLVFPEPEDHEHMQVLSDAYVQSKRSRAKWARFFQKLGAATTPEPRRREWDIGWYSEICPPPDDIPSHLRVLMLSERNASTRGYYVADWAAPGWLRGLMEQSPGNEITTRAKALLAWLPGVSTNYQGTPHSFSAKYEWHYYNWRFESWLSELAHCLLNTPWFPSTKGLRRPQEVFVDRPEIREIFGDSVPYAPPDTPDRVIGWLGLRATATAEDLLAYLKTVASNPASGADRDVVRCIYRRLQHAPFDVQVFAEQPLILVSQPEPRWVTSGQCVWPDLGTVFGDTYVYLAREYGEDDQRFFVNRLGVPRQIDDELYAKAWRQLERETAAPPDKVESAFETIFARLSRIARNDGKPGWWGEFCHSALVWTQSDRFIAAERVFVPDDGELREALREVVEFAWRPQKDSFADHRALYHALGVRSLADSVTMSSAIATPIDGCTVNPILTSAAKRGMCLYLWNEKRRDYERLKESGLLEDLLVTREAVSEGLAVTFALDGRSVTLADRLAYWDSRTHVLYRHTSVTEQLENEVALILARRLARGEQARDLENLIDRVLGSSDGKVDSMAQHHNWSLPEEEQSWVTGTMDLAPALGPDDGEVGEKRGEAEQSTHEKDGPSTGEGDDEIGVDDGGNGAREYPSKERPDIGVPPQPKDQPLAPRRERPSDTEVSPRTEPPSGGSRSRTTTPMHEWLFSHVVTKNDVDDGDPEPGDPDTVRRRQDVDTAGVAFVLAYERECRRTPTGMPHNHPGYDIRSSDRTGMRRYIEVKSLGGAWNPASAVGLTATEFDAARQLGDRYWLYVVEHALDDQRKLFMIQDPANRVVRFYFDHGWKVVSEHTLSSATHGDEV